MSNTIERARFVEVSAEVRYWEDAELNGVPDDDGKVPLRNGALWCPVIDLATGRVRGWPDGIEADIHYKVCDQGEYWLLDDGGRRIAKWKGYYVPDDVLCVSDKGYGDYIIMVIGADGLIRNWSAPELDEDEWDCTGFPAAAPHDDDRAAVCLAACEGIPTEKLRGKTIAEYVTSEAYLIGATLDADSFNASIKGLACQAFAAGLAGQFKAAGAVNFLQVNMEHPELGAFFVAIQRAEGKTPAQLKREAEQERDAAKAEAEAMRTNAERYRLLRERGQCDSKHGAGFTLGDRDKAKVAFRFWCSPEELDAILDAERATTTTDNNKEPA